MPKSSRRDYSREIWQGKGWQIPSQLPIAFRLDFPPRVVELFAKVFKDSGGNFQIFAFETDMLMVGSTTQMLYGLPRATKRPAQCIGFVFLNNPVRFFQPIGETGNMKPEVERLGVTRYQWRVIVDKEFAMQALVVALEQANEMFARIRMRAMSLGALG